MIPVLIKPGLYKFKNILKLSLKDKRELLRTIVIFSLLSLLVLFAHFGTYSALQALASQSDKIFIPSSLPLSLILLVIFFLLFFSSSIATLGNFYLGKDIEFILASPISHGSFFWGKFVQVLIHAGWMACIFAVPMLFAFGSFYSASYEFFVLAIVGLFIFLCIPVSISIIFVTLFAAVVPAKRSRETFLVGILVLLFAIVVLVEPFAEQKGSDLDQTLALLRLFLLPEAQLLPSQWLGSYLHSFLEPQVGDRATWHLLQTLFVALSLISLAFVSIRLLHSYAFSKAQTSTISSKIVSSRARMRFCWLKEMAPSYCRAIFAKELKLFARDTTQTVQLALLLGLCILYLSNFQSLQIGRHLDVVMAVWWESFLVVCNVFLGGLVLVAVCARFVFPSISLEGKSFWLLQSSPLSLRDIMRGKFLFWFVPLGVISSVIFTSGAMAINVDFHIACIHAMASWILAYGIVGLAVGMGAIFSNFEWEHPSQLMSSTGSLLYMISAALLVFISLLPTSFLVIMRTLRNLGHDIPTITWYSIIVLCSAALVCLQHVVVRWAIQHGERALAKKVYQ